MLLNPNIAALPLIGTHGTDPMWLSLILDPAAGPTLVDTCIPGQAEQIAAALAEYGVTIADLKRIILTHHDIDHVGSLRALVDLSGAQVLASVGEAPMIDGRATPRFANPAAWERFPPLREAAAQYRTTPIDQLLEGEVRLAIAGGVLVVPTPGHTPGHVSLFHEPSRTLIAGDALAATAGTLRGPSPQASMDMVEAARSVQRLAALEPATIICYHGGVVDQDAAAQLKRVAEEL